MGEHVYVNCHPLEIKLHSHVINLRANGVEFNFSSHTFMDDGDDETAEKISHRFINKINTSSALPQSSICSIRLRINNFLTLNQF